MSNQLAQIKWGRVVLTALAVYIVSFLTVTLIVTAYATYLAFLSRGAPDQAMIQAFADQYAPWLGPISLILFTVLGARHMVRRVEAAIPLHGIILGALAGLVNIVFDGLSLGTLAIIILTIGAGWLGSRSSAGR
jgi:ATP/ADP translocase